MHTEDVNDPRLQVFRPRTSPEAIDLVAKLLEYTPEARLSAVEMACARMLHGRRNMSIAVSAPRRRHGRETCLLVHRKERVERVEPAARMSSGRRQL